MRGWGFIVVPGSFPVSVSRHARSLCPGRFCPGQRGCAGRLITDPAFPAAGLSGFLLPPWAIMYLLT